MMKSSRCSPFVDDVDPVESAHVALIGRVVARIAEGAEVMSADKRFSAASHRHQVEMPRVVPAVEALVGGGDSAVVEPVAILFAAARESGVEVVAHNVDSADGDGVGKDAVEAVAELEQLSQRPSCQRLLWKVATCLWAWTPASVLLAASRIIPSWRSCSRASVRHPFDRWTHLRFLPAEVGGAIVGESDGELLIRSRCHEIKMRFFRSFSSIRAGFLRLLDQVSPLKSCSYRVKS